MAVARSFSDDNTIRYVLPVLWMTSGCHIKRGHGMFGRIRQMAAPVGCHIVRTGAKHSILAFLEQFRKVTIDSHI